MHSRESLSRRLVAPRGPVTVAHEALAAEQVAFLTPQFPASRWDMTAVSIGLGCIACWLSPVALFLGGLR